MANDRERAEAAGTADGEGMSDAQAFVGCLLVIAALALVGLVGWKLLGAGGDHAVRVPAVPAGRAVELHVEEPSVLSVWADVKVAHRGISYSTGNDELPHVVDIEVVAWRDGQPLATLRCNPFDVHFMKTSWGGTEDGVAKREYDGRIDDCALSVSPGLLRVTVRQVPGRADPRIVLERLDAILRW